MSLLNSVSGIGNSISIGSSAISLIGMGKSLISSDNLKSGIDGFLFDMRVSESVTMTADITDHWTEWNISIQDHIALNPVSITLVGKISELIFSQPAAVIFARAMLDRLGPLANLSPSQGRKAQESIAAYNVANQAAGNVLKGDKDLKSLVSGKPSQNNQQEKFSVIEEYYDRRSLLTVETPWRHYSNMVIESFTAEQDDSSVLESTFTITFKQMNFVEVQNITARGVATRTLIQKASAANRGTQPGKPQSTAHAAFDALGN